jgi:quercetin dioxygenase-like cupin family protein
MNAGRVVRSTEGEVYDDYWLFKVGSRSGGEFDFLVGTIPYLSGPPLHVHERQHDSFYVLEGVLTLQVGDDVIDLEAGDFGTAPPGLPHTFDNIRKDDRAVRACNFMTPGGLDQTFFDMREAGEDWDRLLEALRKNGVSVVGPTLGEKLGLI